MADSTGASSIAHNSLFQDRVNLYLMKVAAYVMIEAGDAANHGKRVTYALKVINGQANTFCAAMLALSDAGFRAGANPNTQDFSIQDSDLDFRVNSIFNTLAEVYNPVPAP